MCCGTPIEIFEGKALILPPLFFTKLSVDRHYPELVKLFYFKIVEPLTKPVHVSAPIQMGTQIRQDRTRVQRKRLQAILDAKFLRQRQRHQHISSLGLSVTSPFVVCFAAL